MNLPKVKVDVIGSLLTEIDSDAIQHNPYWSDNMFANLRDNNPVIAEYLATVKQVNGETATLVGLIVYRLLEAQAEVDQLEGLFDDSV